MIYKFISDDGTYLEVYQSNHTDKNVILELEGDCHQHISLNSERLYDLIGALHSLQSKIKNTK